MKVIDPGHIYALHSYDKEEGGKSMEVLSFMKREGPGYPFNQGHHSGTNCQEVLRVLIDRVKYLNMQIPCIENYLIISSLRGCIYYFEQRAARRHGRLLPSQLDEIELVPTSSKDGHIV